MATVTTISPETRAQMIARRQSKGYADGADLLAELIESHSGDNLAHALVHNEFATPRAAAALTLDPRLVEKRLTAGVPIVRPTPA